MSANPLAALGLVPKAMKMRHKKLTASQWAVIEREADLLIQRKGSKLIAAELGVTEIYVTHAIRRIIQERRGLAPRVTHIFALEKDDPLRQLRGA